MPRIRQNLSSDSLFHFIKNIDWLIEILRAKTFQARYVYEELPSLKYKVGIPMKCFCDIPLGLIKKHLSSYGKFGLGISKNFARDNRISPIFYIHDNSDTLNRYLSSTKKADLLNPNYSLLPYIKLDEIKRVTKSGTTISLRYYDEREWRYVPSEAKFVDFTGFDEDEIKKMKIEDENSKLHKDQYLLKFKYSDISYIFVDKAKDVDEINKEIRRFKLSQREADRLISKITTARQIERDF